MDEQLAIYKDSHLDQQRKILSTNARTRNILTNRPDDKAYNRMMTCEITKEV